MRRKWVKPEVKSKQEGATSGVGVAYLNELIVNTFALAYTFIYHTIVLGSRNF